MSPSDILPPNKHIFHASCRAKKDIFLAYCVPALMTWPPLEDADVWCLAEICECLVSLTPACLVPFHPLAIYNMSLFKFSPPHNIQYVGPALQFTISTCSKFFKIKCPLIIQLNLNWSLATPIPHIKHLVSFSLRNAGDGVWYLVGYREVNETPVTTKD